LKCHQRKIRDEKAKTPLPDEHLRIAAATYNNATLREITFEEAKTIILDYEWLQNMGSTRYAVGMFFGEYLAGVACFGCTAGSNVTKSICGKEHASKVLTLVRGTCVHWAPKDAASFMINRACDMMVTKGYNIFIAYSDEEAGEIGTVYQASNWIYAGAGGTPTRYVHPDGRQKDSRIIGAMTRGRAGRPNTDRKTKVAADPKKIQNWLDKKAKEGYVVKGTGRYRYYEVMTRAEAEAKLLAEGFVKQRGTPKHRYVHFAGDKRAIRELGRALKLKVLPYPKRDAV
jgi:hypothetical protein